MTTGAPDWFKRILLYGEHEGAAVPLACDAQGRIVVTIEVVSPFDKAGTILLEDGFEDGLVHLEAGTHGTGASVAIDNSEAAKGEYSCRLTGGSTSVRMAFIRYRTVPSVVNMIGLEFQMRVGDDVERVELAISVYTGTRLAYITLRWVEATGTWQLFDYESGQYIDIVTTATLRQETGAFYRFKVVLDTLSECYSRFKYPGGEVDLTAYRPLCADDSSFSIIVASIIVYSDYGHNGWILVDDVIITQDES